MCLTCGCGLPYDDMGDGRNVTYDDIKHAVETSDGKGLTADQAVNNLVETWKKVKEDDRGFKQEG